MEGPDPGFGCLAPEPRDISSEDYKAEKFRGADLQEFQSRSAFTLPNAEVFALFEKEFEAVHALLLRPGPSFKEVADRIKEHAETF